MLLIRNLEVTTCETMKPSVRTYLAIEHVLYKLLEVIGKF